MKRLLFLFPALLTVLLALASCQQEPEFNGSALTEPLPAADFTLEGVDGGPVSLSDFEGQVVLIYFGYTYCPDVCPTTMADLARVQAEVDDEGNDLQVMLITVDPQRDTPQVVGQYAAGFHPSFIGLSGTPEEIAEAAADWGVYYQANTDGTDSSYTVDHTSRVFVVDREGRYRLSFPFGMERELMIADVEVLLRE